MKTSFEYIHEYSFLDDVIEASNNLQESILIAESEYKRAIRDIEMRTFFEDVEEPELLMEKEGKSILEKIGEKVLQLISSVTKFVKNITETIRLTTSSVRSDKERVNRMLAKNPELKEVVAKGLRQEWFTYKDLVQYERDMVGLMNLIREKKLSSKDFYDRLDNIANKFDKSAKPIIRVGSNVRDIMNIIPGVGNACSEARQTVVNFTGMLEKIHDDTQKNLLKNSETRGVQYNGQDYEEITLLKARTNAMARALGLATKECEVRVQGQRGISNFFNKLVNTQAATNAAETNRAAREHLKNVKDDQKYQANRSREIQRNLDKYEDMLITRRGKTDIANRYNSNNPQP